MRGAGCGPPALRRGRAAGRGGASSSRGRKSLCGLSLLPVRPRAAARPHLRGLTSAILISDSQNSRRRGAAPGAGRAGATGQGVRPARLLRAPGSPSAPGAGGRGRRGRGRAAATLQRSGSPGSGQLGPRTPPPVPWPGVWGASCSPCVRPAKWSPRNFQRSHGGGGGSARRPSPPGAQRSHGEGGAVPRTLGVGLGWEDGRSPKTPAPCVFGEGMSAFPSDRVGS